MVITGAGPGIMEAGIEGAGADRAFGVNILLPFEATSSPLLEGDPKLINYRYFFTRKLTFLKESQAFALLPGGFGTMDEAFELLTLMQTGRSPICPGRVARTRGRHVLGHLAFVRRARAARSAARRRDRSRPRVPVPNGRRGGARDHAVLLPLPLDALRRPSARDPHEAATSPTTTWPSSTATFADIVVNGEIERVTASDSERQDDDVARPAAPRLPFRPLALRPAAPPHRRDQRGEGLRPPTLRGRV